VADLETTPEVIVEVQEVSRVNDSLLRETKDRARTRGRLFSIWTIEAREREREKAYKCTYIYIIGRAKVENRRRRRETCVDVIYLKTCSSSS